MPLAVSSMRLPVAGMPRNSPGWVPRVTHRAATLSASARRSSTAFTVSGKAWCQSATERFMFSKPPMPGFDGLFPGSWGEQFVGYAGVP